MLYVVVKGRFIPVIVCDNRDTIWQLQLIQDLLPPENTGEGRPSKSNRVMLNGMLWKVKTGAPCWRDLPERCGP